MATSFHEGIRPDLREMRRPSGSCPRVLALLVGLFAAMPVRAEPERPIVDLELILAVDVSSSMSEAEQRLQRDGYASAFRHPDIAKAIASGAIGRIAVLYFEWAGPADQRIGVPWTILTTQKDAMSLADSLAALPFATAPATSISGSLLFAQELFGDPTLRSSRHVIDISGDGTNNAGPPVVRARDLLVSQGIIINGLPIMLPTDASRDSFTSFSRPLLELYFEDCVIGGPGAFVIGVHDTSRFKSAILRKLVMEIPSRPAELSPASARVRQHPPIDCAAPGEQPGR